MTCASAASVGHLAVLQWAHANGCPWHYSTCSDAASGGHLEVLQWALNCMCSSLCNSIQLTMPLVWAAQLVTIAADSLDSRLYERRPLAHRRRKLWF
eukprot:m.112486 g.112486  ORF g.112486 m.112486 type:complete len:97 (-) comp12968_c0_seq1:29-319(-)